MALVGTIGIVGTALGSPALAVAPASDAGAATAQADVAAAAVDTQVPKAPEPSTVTSDEVPASDQIQPLSPVFSAARNEHFPDFMLGGYAEAGVAVSDRESGSGSTFFGASFNPALYIRYQNILLFESELEITVTEDGDTETVLEFAQLDLLLHDNLVLVLGKFSSPVGQFAERLHPAWINRLPDAPAGFGHDGLQPGAEVGIQLRGGLPVGRSRVTYAVAIGNGPRLMEDGALEQEGFGGDDNDNKAVSGRIGFLPMPYLEFGASFQTAKVRPMPMFEEEAETEAESMAEGPNTRLNMWGVDAAYTRGAWDVRMEFLRGIRDSYELAPAMDGDEPSMFSKMKLETWYAQIAYRLSGVTQHRIMQNFEPVVRYGEYTIKGMPELAEEAQEKRWDVGLNYWFGPAVVLHGALQHRNFTAREAGDRKDTRFLVQLGYGF